MFTQKVLRHFVLMNTILIMIWADSYGQKNWSWRNPLPQGNQLNSVANYGSMLVAVGWIGTILISKDGVAWENRKSGTSETLNSIIGNDKQLVAVGDNGTILTSMNGVTWMKMNSKTKCNLRSVIYTDSQFVAVGSHDSLNKSMILISRDGITWETCALIIDDNDFYFDLNSVTWTGHQLVAVGFNGTSQSLILTSLNGINWIKIDKNFHAILYSITWTGKQLVTVGYNGYVGTILTSPDGVTWTERTSSEIRDEELGAQQKLHSVTWTGTKLVAVGNSDTIRTSEDGVTWSKYSSGLPLLNSDIWTGSSASEPLNSVIWTGTQLVAVGGDGNI
jgi:hypothetical protein